MSISSSSSAAAAAGGSTSTIVAETTTGWHELKIPGGYAKTKGGNGKGIDSIPFTVGEHTWYIRYYPDGNNDKSSGWVSVYLYLSDHPSAGDVKAKYKFTLISDDDDGGDVDLSSYTRTSSSYSFWSPGKPRGYYQFVKATDMEASLKGHSFRLRCDVTVVKETCITTTTTTDTSLITIPPPDLQHHLGELLDSEVGGDVTFTVGGERFTAHKYVLAARSPVLVAELFGPMKENTTTMSIIQIHDVEPRVFKAMLRFIYTDEMTEVDDDDEFSEVGMAQHLLVAADKYGLKRLKAMCEAKLLECMDAGEVATTMTLAEQHGCEGLKEGCFRFMRCPGVTKAVMESEGFQHLRTSCPCLIEEMLAKLAP